jgi:hypothetical protein
MRRALIGVLTFLLFHLNPCDAQSSNTSITSYIDFLRNQNLSAKDYILELFKTHDVVILCERDHKEFTQYRLFLEVVKDQYFIDHVGHIFTEVGVANLDKDINGFLMSKQKSSVATRNRITSIYREIDYTPYWECYSYPWFLGELFKINQGLSKERKLVLHPSDYEFAWPGCKTAKEYKAFNDGISNRDSMMAQNIIKRFNFIRSGSDQRKKALVILNYKHAFLKDHRFLGNTLHNTGTYLSAQYKDKLASVYIMGLAIPEYGKYTVVKNGKWDYSFETANKLDIGFNLKNSPFGSEEFDVIPPDSLAHYKYEEMFTGIIFYRLYFTIRFRSIN